MRQLFRSSEKTQKNSKNRRKSVKSPESAVEHRDNCLFGALCALLQDYPDTKLFCCRIIQLKNHFIAGNRFMRKSVLMQLQGYPSVPELLQDLCPVL